jgi:Arc/MetJ-type ribon-helix-helix transcriptional regulator
MMVRTQIQLTEKQARRLKRLAAAQGRSMADLIRSGVDALLAASEGSDDDVRRQRALAAIGRFRSGVRDLATAQDRYAANTLDR